MTPSPPPVRAVIPLAEGVEEMEAVILADVFRRAEWDVVLAGLRDGPVTASRGVTLTPDAPLAALNTDDWDLLALPGGMGGVEAMIADETVLAWCRGFAAAPDKNLAAICAAAMVLEKAGVLAERRFTCHPGVVDRIADGHHQAQRVVEDGRLHTSQGPGTAFDFALHLVRVLDAPEKAIHLRKAMCL